jgi:enamine deaminase RidA (YjgF/YER057c/UK114 family)
MTAELIHPDGWPRGAGYAHGSVATGRVVCVAGQVGWDPRTEQMVGTGMAEQAAQALANVAAVLAAADAAPTDLVRMTWFITDRAAYIAARADIGAAWRQHFGRHYPAMSVVVVRELLEDGALVEIEATAVAPVP